jgi:hypothetical protein
MGDIVCSKNVLILYRSDFQNDPEIGSRILGHAGLWREPAEDPLLQLVRSSIDDLDGLLTEPASIPQSLQNLTKTVLAPSIHYGCTGQRVPVVWPRDCLYWGDQPGLPLPRVLELTGPARVLVYGPYYVLPVGTWRIRVTLAVSASACKTPLALELHGAAELARFQFSVDQPGLFVASMVITIRSAREPLECRLTVLRGAIEGQLGLDRIEFTPEPG